MQGVAKMTTFTTSIPMTYRDTKVITCECGVRGIKWAAQVDGEWATGATLPSGYMPPPDELVRIHSWWCPGCGLQVS